MIRVVGGEMERIKTKYGEILIDKAGPSSSFRFIY